MYPPFLPSQRVQKPYTNDPLNFLQSSQSNNPPKNIVLQVLCELQVALVERQLSSRPDVTRDIMSPEFRAISSSETFRNLRDWLIFRDYMNGLEYVVQVFEHLRRNLQSWGWQGGSRRRATRRRLAHLRKPEPRTNLDGGVSSWDWRSGKTVKASSGLLCQAGPEAFNIRPGFFEMRFFSRIIRHGCCQQWTKLHRLRIFLHRLVANPVHFHDFQTESTDIRR